MTEDRGATLPYYQVTEVGVSLYPLPPSYKQQTDHTTNYLYRTECLFNIMLLLESIDNRIHPSPSSVRISPMKGIQVT